MLGLTLRELNLRPPHDTTMMSFTDIMSASHKSCQVPLDIRNRLRVDRTTVPTVRAVLSGKHREIVPHEGAERARPRHYGRQHAEHARRQPERRERGPFEHTIAAPLAFDVRGVLDGGRGRRQLAVEMTAHQPAAD